MDAVEKIPEDVLPYLQFSVPWQSNDMIKGTVPRQDADGFPIQTEDPITKYDNYTWSELQRVCWEKFNRNPQINTHVRDMMGRIAGDGFDIGSSVVEIQDIVEEMMEDPRNRLWTMIPKFVARSEIEGEMANCLTVHKDGFIEVDFMDPGCLASGGDNSSGIIFHPTKSNLPLVYLYQLQTPDNQTGTTTQTYAFPSIYLAYYPELYSLIKDHSSLKGKEGIWDLSYVKKEPYKSKLNGYYRFIVAWDKGFITKRNTSHIRTVIEWLNYYEMLKRYEIDHKRSAGAYLWVAKITDIKTFRLWVGMSQEEREKTGLYSKKVPGGTLVLPPGVEFACHNPNLPKISEQDTDILHMVTSGLNKPEDMVTGQSTGTYASVKASRDPQNDRLSDEQYYFSLFLKYEFFMGVFFLMEKMGKIQSHYEKLEVIGWKDTQKIIEKVDEEGKSYKETIIDKEPITRKRRKKPYQLIDISFPVSAITNVEGAAKAFLGVKHGSVKDVLGIPNEEIAKKIGFGNYKRLRLREAAEKLNLPETTPNEDAESRQERTEAEPAKKKLNRRSK
ncbi:MAG: hypothetical protein ACOC80_05030 [Petrotogales bacterium]